MGTGELGNPEEVLTAQTRERMAAAALSDTMVQIVTRPDREEGAVTTTPSSGRLTYRFRADNVRDFVWTTSDRQLWTGTSALVPDRDGDGQVDRVAIHSFWREDRAPLWEDQALYGKHSIEFHSRFTAFTYPWPHMTSVEGDEIIGGGMEYPMFTLIGAYRGRDVQGLYGVTAHELGHMWVPMIVGADEKRHAWIDEGCTTFLENQAKPDYWPDFYDADSADAEAYLTVARLEMEGILMRHGDFYAPGPGYGIASYQKPATLLDVLRNLLGEETFMRAYRAFISEWAFKHPSPWDFFNTFERFAGRDMDWFWSSWYYETWTLDHGVAGVRSGGDGPVVTIEDHGFVPMPALVRIETSEGGTVEREIPVSYWLTGETTYEVQLPGSVGTVTRVEIDPEWLYPDKDRGNNVWSGG
jgi:aminopeptidase N